MSRTVSLFLSSPGDCDLERESVRSIVAKINADPACRRDGIQVVVEESTGVPYSSASSPQQDVDSYRKLPNECDLYVCIFRSRFGTPPEASLTKPDGTPCQSGTEYEFHLALDQAKRTPMQPHMLTYRYVGPADLGADANKLRLIEDFFASEPFADSQARCTGGYHTYDGTENFSELVERHLREFIFKNDWFDVWMLRHCERFVQDAGPRYTQEAHVETDIMYPFEWLLRTEKAFRELDEKLAKIYEHIPFNNPQFQDIKPEFDQLALRFQSVEIWRDGFPIGECNTLIQNARDRLEIALDSQRDLVAAFRQEKEEGKPREEFEKQVRIFRRLEEAFDALREASSTLSYSEVSALKVLLLTGEAGIGKTHTLVEEVSRCVGNGGVAVGIFGHKLRNVSSLRSALFQQLDCPHLTNFSEFLTLLDRKARERKCVALLAIDALNETVPRSCWQDELAGLLTEIGQYPQIAVVMAVRSDYASVTLPTECDVWVPIEHQGFAGVEPDALQKFFSAYSINAPVYPPILPEFTNPLYLKLLCQTLQAQGQHQCPLPIPSWLDIHKNWMAEVQNKALRHADLNLDQLRHTQIQRFLDSFSDRLLVTGGTVSRDEAEEISRPMAGDRASHFVSFIISEQVLFESFDEASGRELLRFGYERSSDTYLADRLLRKLLSPPNSTRLKIIAFLNKIIEKLLRKLLSPPSRSRNEKIISHALTPPSGVLRPYVTRGRTGPANRSGILRALMLLVPKEVGRELTDLLAGEDMAEGTIARAWFDSLLWRTQPSEFGGDDHHLWSLVEKYRPHLRWRAEDELDRWIRIGLIAQHPFAMTRLLHPWLKGLSMPERDAKWTIHLVPMWSDEQSMLYSAVKWAVKQNRAGILREVAWSLSLLLCWCCASTNTGLREDAAQGLCRLLVACPEIAEDLLREFESCDDAYIVEMLLAALLGAVLNSCDGEWIARVAQLVFEQHFSAGNARWCHLHIRHYARRIVERGLTTGKLTGLAIPSFRSSLPLDDVPPKKQLYDDAGDIRGQRSIVHSSTDNDFYRYILGGNSVSIPFTSLPLPQSDEKGRPHLGNDRPMIGTGQASPGVFDIGLAGRFIAWNCLQLGWTPERFGVFDEGHWISTDRIIQGHKTERIGKKYQWIGWRTLQAFLADNYFAARRFHRADLIRYNEPKDIDEKTIDPLLWLKTDPADVDDDGEAPPFELSAPWPKWDKESIAEWHENPEKEPSFERAVFSSPPKLQTIAAGQWLHLTISQTWKPGWRPGNWEQGATSYDKYLNVWLMAWVKLIKHGDLDELKQKLADESVQNDLVGKGRADYSQLDHLPLDRWAEHNDPDIDGFKSESGEDYCQYWPVDYAEMLVLSGMENEFTLPTPWLVREWGLTFDLTTGIYSLPDGRPLLANLFFQGGPDRVFAHLPTLREQLDESEWELTWFVRSEQMASLNHHAFSRTVSMHGVAGLEGREVKMWWKGYEKFVIGG